MDSSACYKYISCTAASSSRRPGSLPVHCDSWNRQTQTQQIQIHTIVSWTWVFVWLHATLVLAGQNRLSVCLSVPLYHSSTIKLSFFFMRLPPTTLRTGRGKEEGQGGLLQKWAVQCKEFRFGPLKLLSLKRHKMSIKIISQFARSLSLSLSLILSLLLPRSLCTFKLRKTLQKILLHTRLLFFESNWAIKLYFLFAHCAARGGLERGAGRVDSPTVCTSRPEINYNLVKTCIKLLKHCSQSRLSLLIEKLKEKKRKT